MQLARCVVVAGCLVLPVRLAHAQCPSFSSEFGFPGVAIPGVGGSLPEEVYTSAFFDSGTGPRFYVGGNFTLAGEGAAEYLAVWDGVAWSPVGASNSLPNEVHALQVFDDGSGSALFVAGAFNTVAGVSSNCVAKWDGANWIALPGLIGPRANDLAVFDDGTGPALYIGGSITKASGLVCGGVAKWTGSAWTRIHASFPGGDVSELESYDVGSGSRLFIGGFNNAVFNGVAHSICAWDGASFQSLGSGLSSYVTALYGYDDGSGPKLFAGGWFLVAGGVPANAVARWDGTSWMPAGTLGPDQPLDFVHFDDGSGDKLLAGCMPYGAPPHERTLMQWDGVDWQLYQGATAHSGAVFELSVGDDGSGHGDELYIGGQFVRAGTTRALRVARLRNLQWEALGAGQGKAREVSALTVHDDGTGPAVYASSGEQPTTFAMISFDRVERWNGASWTALGEQADGYVNVLGSCNLGGGAELIAGGYFTELDGVAANSIARWNGSSWQALGSGVTTGSSIGSVWALAQHDDGSGPRLFAAGSFTSAGGVPVGGVAAWNGSTWSDVGGGTTGTVYCMTTFDSGSGPELYIGGGFSVAGSVSAVGVARWDGASWHDVGGGMAGGLNEGVRALASFDDGSGAKLYAGGKFTMAGGSAALRIAVWDGTSWSQVSSGADAGVLSFAVHDDGFGPQLYAGGRFQLIGGVVAHRFARWNGSQWFALADVEGGPVDALASFEPTPGRREVWLAGGFTHAGGLVSSKIARWSEQDRCSPTTYCTPKQNSQGCSPVIFATGTASATANNFRVKASNVLNNKSGLMFWGFAAKAAPFQGGWLCVKPPTIRTPVQDSSGNAPPDDCSGSYSFHWNANYMNAQGLAAGQRVFCQYWSRDPASASTTGLTGGLSFLIEP